MDKVVLPLISGSYKCMLFEPTPNEFYLRFGSYEEFHVEIAVAFMNEAGLRRDQIDPGEQTCIVRGGAGARVNLEQRTMLIGGFSLSYRNIPKEPLQKLIEEKGFVSTFR